MIKQYGQHLVYLSTDDPKIANETVNYPDIKWRWQHIDRKKYDTLVINDDNKALETPQVGEEAFKDLWAMASCDMFVGSFISSMGTIAFEAITARRGFRPPYVSVETPPAYRLAGSTLLFPDEPDHPKSPCWCTMDRKKLNYDRPPGCRCDRFEKYAQRAEAGAAAEGRAGGK